MLNDVLQQTLASITSPKPDIGTFEEILLGRTAHPDGRNQTQALEP
jgi:hypothetical protein